MADNKEAVLMTDNVIGVPCDHTPSTKEIDKEEELSDMSHGLGDDIVFVRYSSELQMPAIMKLIKEDLSEPYSIYTYRYFINNWPELCWMVNIT